MTKSKADYEKDYTKSALREHLREEIKAGDKGAKPGQWSARKSQLLNQEYEKAGGGYKHDGCKTKSQKSLQNWSKKH